MKAEELDKKFDDGEDIIEYLDLSTLKRPELESEQVNINFPHWMVKELDKEANRLGIERQSLIKFWISERLDNLATR
ncbi:MAG: CopG family antitoxin [Xenococcaceae cyanobacterium MO_207.B15]|nr:CopG family antitoxin [Xenococcaceae cyanobacterium MO_207.B15]MDJ0745304.1 CopG family antitoxin [Xenococcaceae cyanobacterium MO_167.B27]